MQIDLATLDSLKKAKLIAVKQSTSYPELYTVKYARKVFYDNLWSVNPLLTLCRGLVIDAEGNVVVLPFEKVFNRNETPDADIPGNHVVTCVRKVNGFLGVVTYHSKYGWIYSTTGSLDSDFVGYIKDHVCPVKNKLDAVHGQTYLFEICHKDDPHIIQEKEGAYLIGIRHSNQEMATEAYLDSVVARYPGIMRPESFKCEMKEVNDHLRKCQHEGYMVIDTESNKTIKMKSPFYLIRKMIARKQDLNAALTNANKIRHNMDEEFYCLLDAIEQNKELVQAMDEHTRLQFMTDVLLEKFK